MAGHQDPHHLVVELRRGHLLRRLVVSRGHHQAEQIRLAGIALPQPVGHHGVEDAVKDFVGAIEATVLGVDEPLHGMRYAQEVQRRHGVDVVVEVVQRPLDELHLVLDGGAEARARDCADRDGEHVRVDVARLAALGRTRPGRAHLLRFLDDHPRKPPDGLLVKGRLHALPLAAPDVAVRGEEARPPDLAGVFVASRLLVVVLVPVVQHVLDVLRLRQQHDQLTRERELHDVPVLLGEREQVFVRTRPEAEQEAPQVHSPRPGYALLRPCGPARKFVVHRTPILRVLRNQRDVGRGREPLDQ